MYYQTGFLLDVNHFYLSFTFLLLLPGWNITPPKIKTWLSKFSSLVWKDFLINLSMSGNIWILCPTWMTIIIQGTLNFGWFLNTNGWHFRVLYERVLTEDLTNGDKMESVWNKYLEFECNVGDLQSMQKVSMKNFTKDTYLWNTRLKIDEFKKFSTEQTISMILIKKLKLERNLLFLLIGKIWYNFYRLYYFYRMIQ